jgi:hypothetical protein
MRSKRSRRPVYVNLAQRLGCGAQIGAALVTKPAHFTRDRGLALGTCVNHSEYAKLTYACAQAVKIILQLQTATDAKSVCGLNQL